MRKFKFTIGSNDYEVEIKSFDTYNAEVKVNDETFDVDIEYPKSDEPEISTISRKKKADSAPKKSKTSAEDSGESIKAPMPGLILKVLVSKGDEVKIGQKVAIMEAMKMENDINSVVSGTVKSVNVSDGDNVQENQTLFVIA
ncbi:MAG: biotin/lipoyl-containing protein [bacterium]